MAATGTVDGVDSFALVDPPHSDDPLGAVAFTMDSHPLWLWAKMGPRERNFYMNTVRPRPNVDEMQSLGLKFTSYSSGVGSAFDTRACSIEGHNAAVTMLSSNPELRAFAKHRLSEHTANLQQLLQPSSLNTRYNFLNMDLAEKLFPEESNCGSVLAETVKASNSANIVALSFVAGLTTAAFAFVAHLKFKKNTAVTEQDSPYSVM